MSDRNARYMNKKRDARPIIGIDFEGVDYPDGRHELILLGSSATDEIDLLGPTGASSSYVLDSFLLPLLLKNPDAIFVSFGFDYDTRMIFRDLSPDVWEALKTLSKGRSVLDKRYLVRYETRERGGMLQITFLKEYITVKHKKKADERRHPVLRIYDVQDFFEGMSFVDAVELHLGPNLSTEERDQLERVRVGKNERSKFKPEDIEKISAYWDDEIYFLPLLVQSVRDALAKYLDIHLVEWTQIQDVTSRVAGRFGIGDIVSRDNTPTELIELFRDKDYGGRVEPFYLGRVGETVWENDISSAYGAAMRQLPDLRNGKWEEVSEADFVFGRDFKMFALYDVSFSNFDHLDTAPQPVPLRVSAGMLYPTQGRSWIWGPELANLVNLMEFKVHKAVIFQDDGTNPVRPFVDYMWSTRQLMREDGVRAEKVVKNAISRVYGKFAQKKGTIIDPLSGEEVRTPSWQQLEYAGFITSYCRAELFRGMMLAIGAGGRVFNCSTDAFRTDVDLRGILPIGDEIGQWRTEECADLVIMGTNLYMTQSLSGKWTIKKPGYGGFEITPERILGELANPKIWVDPVYFERTYFDDIERVWLREERAIHVGDCGKRIHTWNCMACYEGESLAEEAHTLVPRGGQVDHGRLSEKSLDDLALIDKSG